MATSPATPRGDPAPSGGGAALLRCGACGSRERVRAPSRRHGWQRCRHCGSVIVAPWSDVEAFDGPSARTVVTLRPGRAHFTVPRRTLVSSLHLAAWLFLVNMLAAFGVAIFEIEAAPGSAWRWLGPLAFALTGLGVSLGFVNRWRTVQHLEINPRRMEHYRTRGGRRLGARAQRLPERVEVVAGDLVETASEKRFAVALRDADAGTPLAKLVVADPREAQWVAALLRHSVRDDAGASAMRCCGCGAPVEVDLETRARGSARCPFCDAGFVVGTREIHWAPLAVPLPEDFGAGDAPSANVTRHRESRSRRGGRSWRIASSPLAHRLFAAVGLAANTLLFGGFGVVSLWISGHTPEGAVGLSIYLVFGAAMMFGIAGFALLLALLLLFGREEIGMDEAALWRRSRLGPIDLSRWLRTPEYRGPTAAPVRWRSAAASVPLLRLTRVATRREDGLTHLELATPAQTFEASWQLPPLEDRALRRELATLLADRVRALGRRVELVEAPASAPDGARHTPHRPSEPPDLGHPAHAASEEPRVA